MTEITHPYLFEQPTAAEYEPGSGPRNAIVVLLDSLNRRMLGCYGGDEFETPNLDRLAARGLRFDRHYSASLPCMPARHDILCGAWDFLWKPWGSIELWESNIAHSMKMKGVATGLISDHPHLFETGGENYHTDFGMWDYMRGHEGDPWRLRDDPSWIGTPALPSAEGWFRRSYDTSRTYFKDETDFPGPRTMQATADWLDRNANQHERFFLFVDEFDPHEPFDTPEPWAYKYHDQREEDLIIWPPYMQKAIEKGVLTEEQAFQVRANYGAKLSMIDHWFGKILDAMDRNNLWDDTALFIVTDHGHYLGERNETFGKPMSPIFNLLGHIPMLVHWPGVTAGSRQALTTSVDVHATLVDLFDLDVEHRTHGVSLRSVIEGQEQSARDYMLQGYFGLEVNVIDSAGKYIRGAEGPVGDISIWSNRWSTMPMHIFPNAGLPRPDGRAWLDRMPGSEIPVIRQPLSGQELSNRAVLLAGRGSGDKSYLFDYADEQETENLVDSERTHHYEELLRHALEEVEAPDEQFVRLGLN